MKIKYFKSKGYIPALNVAIVMSMIGGATLFAFIVQGVNRDYSRYAGFEKGVGEIRLLEKAYDIQSVLSSFQKLLYEVKPPALSDNQMSGVRELGDSINLYTKEILRIYPENQDSKLYSSLLDLSERIEGILLNGGEIQQKTIVKILQSVIDVQLTVRGVSRNSTEGLSSYIFNQDYLLQKHNSTLLSVILLLVIGVYWESLKTRDLKG